LIEFFEEFTDVCNLLAATRPTAVNLCWALERMKDCARAHADLPGSELKAALFAEAQAIAEEDIITNEKMARYGASLGENGRYAAFPSADAGYQVMGRVPDTYQRQAGPKSRIFLSKLGRVWIQMNRFDEALPPLKKALDVDPDNVNSYVQLGRVYHANKNYPDGRSVLEEAVQINPFNPMIYRLLADIYTALGDQDKAKQAKATLDKLLTAN